MSGIPDWLQSRLACPRDGLPLTVQDQFVRCAAGHDYPVHDGIPILLRDDVAHTHEAALYALRGADDPEHFRTARGPIDPFVQEAIGATGGYLYAGLVGRLTEYPIPEIRLPPGDGRTFLDIGCSWGRWSVAAARLGYRVVGIDPSLVGVRAARRVARQLGVDAVFLVADARHLPFTRESFDTAFSYSVIQHFSKADARQALAEIGRILAPGGMSLIQLPNALGVRSIYHQWKRRFREAKLFEVRYWTVRELRRTFEALIGPSTVSVDGFLSLNPQLADVRLLPAKARGVVMISEALRRLALMLPVITHVADSLYVESRRAR
jgi:SAM-dependent methyltransferase